ncbi:MAG: glycosyltransferase family 4 protein [Planctomycetales bacterium]|nr:glycosyltransferase family 4 protein [Planctomycetales bacterium]
MKLLQLFHNLNVGATEMAVQLAARPDVELTVMCEPESKRQLDLKDAGIDVRPLQFRSKLDWQAVRVLRRELQRQRYDVVHAFTSRTMAGAMLATTWLPAAPAIVGYRGIMDPVRKLDPASWLTFLHPRLKAVSCISDSCRSGLEQSGVSRPVLRTIHLGLVPSPGVEQTWEQYGIPANAFVAVFVGNIRPVKGVDVLLAAAKQLFEGDTFPGVNGARGESMHSGPLHFALIGEVRDQAISELAKSPALRDRVHLLGPVPNAQRLLGNASLFVMPSRREGLCKSLMEAMSRGVCPVISNVGGMPELVRHEQDGLVVEPEQPAALAAAIRRLVEDHSLRQRLAASAQQRIESEFSVERMTERTHQLYKDVLVA